MGTHVSFLKASWSHQTYDSWPVDGLSEEEGEVAHDVDDQGFDDPRLLRELQEEGGHAAHQGSDGLEKQDRRQLRGNSWVSLRPK